MGRVVTSKYGEQGGWWKANKQAKPAELLGRPAAASGRKEQEGKGLCKPVLHANEVLLQRGLGAADGMSCARDSYRGWHCQTQAHTAGWAETRPAFLLPRWTQLHEANFQRHWKHDLDISLLQFPAKLTLLSDLHRQIPACRDPAEILKQDQGLHLPAPVSLTFTFRHSYKT